MTDLVFDKTFDETERKIVRHIFDAIADSSSRLPPSAVSFTTDAHVHWCRHHMSGHHAFDDVNHFVKSLYGECVTYPYVGGEVYWIWVRSPQMYSSLAHEITHSFVFQWKHGRRFKRLMRRAFKSLGWGRPSREVLS